MRWLGKLSTSAMQSPDSILANESSFRFKQVAAIALHACGGTPMRAVPFLQEQLLALDPTVGLISEEHLRTLSAYRSLTTCSWPCLMASTPSSLQEFPTMSATDTVVSLSR